MSRRFYPWLLITTHVRNTPGKGQLRRARQLNSQANRTEKRWEGLLAVQHWPFVNANGLSMEYPDLEQVLPITRPSRSCRDLNHGRPYIGCDLTRAEGETAGPPRPSLRSPDRGPAAPRPRPPPAGGGGALESPPIRVGRVTKVTDPGPAREAGPWRGPGLRARRQRKSKTRVPGRALLTLPSPGLRRRPQCAGAGHGSVPRLRFRGLRPRLGIWPEAAITRPSSP
jgi:hypothetical protein